MSIIISSRSFFSRAHPAANLQLIIWPHIRTQAQAQAQAQAERRSGYFVTATSLLDVNRRRAKSWTSEKEQNFELNKNPEFRTRWEKLGADVGENRHLKTKARVLEGAGKSNWSRRAMASGSPPRAFGGADTSDDADSMLSFRVSEEVKLVLQKGNITEWHIDGETDAIVNAANEKMLGGGGVDGAIHRRAGRQLVEACAKFPQVRPNVRCPTGEARLTSGFRLPAKWVIHTVGPIYSENPEENARLLSLAYRKSLEAAVVVGAQYVAFPAISCGVYGYPMDEAAEVSLQTIQEIPKGVSEVHFVLYNDEAYDAYCKEAERRFTRE